MQLSAEQVACEDLKAFERRLTEVIASSHPTALRWWAYLHNKFKYAIWAICCWFFLQNYPVHPKADCSGGRLHFCCHWCLLLAAGSSHCRGEPSFVCMHQWTMQLTSKVDPHTLLSGSWIRICCYPDPGSTGGFGFRGVKKSTRKNQIFLSKILTWKKIFF